jgi:ribosome biogenesis GTPase
MRELSLWADEGQLDSTFEDIEACSRSCRFRDCSHQAEPGCAVLQAIEAGELEAERFESYKKQKAEINALVERRAEQARRQDKGRGIAQFTRHLKKRGGKWAR